MVRVPRSARLAAGWLLLSGALVVSALGARTAHAALLLELSDGVSTVTLADGSPLDSNPEVGSVSFLGSVGGFLINLSTGISKPILGGPDVAALDLSSFNVSGSPNAVLSIRLTDTDFTQEPLAGAISAVGGTTGGKVSISTYADFDNVPFGTGVLLADFGTFENTASYGAVAFDTTEVTSFIEGVDVSPPFSLTVAAQIMHGAAWQTTGFDVAVTTFNSSGDTGTPAPGGIAALGTGLAAFAFLRRRRARTAARKG